MKWYDKIIKRLIDKGWTPTGTEYIDGYNARTSKELFSTIMTSVFFHGDLIIYEHETE